MSESSKAVVLLSGGLDSATVLALARHDGHSCHALSFDYGQRHRFELGAASRVASSLGAAEHLVIPIDLRTWGGSALTGSVEVPRSRDLSDDNIPVTYVPARNIIFLSLALGWAEVLGARDIYIGANALDYSGYPDCRPEFIEQFEKMAAAGTKAGTEGRGARIRAPLITMTKAEIIQKGVSLGVDYGLTHSCYDPQASGAPCGSCDSCRLREKGFSEAGLDDPLVLSATKA